MKFEIIQLFPNKVILFTLIVNYMFQFNLISKFYITYVEAYTLQR
jgi:hypothetical protein